MFGISTGRRPGRFTRMDRELAVALVLYEDGLCRGCGQPAHQSFDPRNTGEFEVDPKSPTCEACAVLESERNERHTPGQKRRIRNYLMEV